MDSAYLKSTVGSVLAKGIAETVVAKPSDPIDYLAQFLLKSVADEKEEKFLKTAQKAETERTQAAEAKAAAAKEAADATAEAVVVQKGKGGQAAGVAAGECYLNGGGLLGRSLLRARAHRRQRLCDAHRPAREGHAVRAAAAAAAAR